MQEMCLSDNPFTGKIPDFIGNWTNLKLLRLEGNYFEGPIPSSFPKLTSLESLRIIGLSNVSSSLDFIRNLKNLTSLILRNALITGSIPSDIGELQNLQNLDLSFNNLTGHIPSALFTIKLLGIGPKPNTFSYAELRAATDDFSPLNKLGEGGFGSVYKGKLFDGRVVAVKQLSVASHQGTSQFVTEIATISMAWTLYESNQSLGLLDPTLVEFDENEALRMIRVGLLCTQASPMMRPPMSRVVTMLAGDIEASPVVSKPSYLTDWDFKDITSSIEAENTPSTGSEHSDNKNKNNLNPGIELEASPLNITKFSDIIGEGR
ncbi:hypothetical protein SLEP1_g51503 [Rubroshorea leprosula]|uniref:Uncharacterized protein n=1 Tax=Rubroshorea leprosula TaxID=152421 RepID=A0AAV5M3L2_9ROSI|nr:hypothetical protein SLEP1_g51503 [Rubroshorea leprosula]